MLNPMHVMPIAFGQAFLPQSLSRTPEVRGQSAVMDNEKSVAQYDLAMQSKLAIVYAGAIQWVHRAKRRVAGGRAIDLCCGPGHFTLLLAKYFDFDEIVGVDLSPPMIKAANANARAAGLEDRVRFVVGDATNVPAGEGDFDVVCCNDAAHHMPDLNLVNRLLMEIDRLSGTNGIGLLTDLVRLKTTTITNRYTRLIGQDYLERGLDSFQADFCNSMQAAWTGQELRECLPKSSRKHWIHRVQKILPTIQVMLGYPDDEQAMFLRDGVPWNKTTHPVPPSMRMDWNMFRYLL